MTSNIGVRQLKDFGDGVGFATQSRQDNQDENNKAIIEKLRKGGVEFGNVVTSDLPQNLVGKAIVVTGSVEGFTREEAEAAIKDRGGKSPGSVSAKTYCVVVGEDPGASKVTKATELGIPMIQADAFQKLLDTGSI